MINARGETLAKKQLTSRKISPSYATPVGQTEGGGQRDGAMNR
jgi:hypothetical protein